MTSSVPLPAEFTPREWRLVQQLNTPRKVQRWLNALPYNTEIDKETLRSFREVIRTGHAHCLEAALAAAVILEQHGHPPIVMSIESKDWLDHVVFLYRERDAGVPLRGRGIQVYTVASRHFDHREMWP